MSNRVLLIEDDFDMQTLIKDYLSNYEFDVVAYANPLEAIKALKEEEFSVVVLDLMLPNMDGFDVCKRIRESSNIPIIISSARGELSDKILCFDFGADDYLAKPYEPRELVLRIQSILKRLKKEGEKIGDFELNFEAKEIKLGGYLIEFTKVEFEIMTLFLTHPNKAYSRKDIANSVNAIEYDTKDRTIDMHISNIRQKIESNPKEPHYIKSIWGIGYKFVV